MTEKARPTLARRQLGRVLRRLRLEAGKTHEDLKTAGIASRSKMSMIETGRTVVKAADIYAFSALYRLTAGQTDQLLAMAEATKTSGMQESLEASMPDRFNVYGDLLDAASVLRIHATEMVHGLFQTEDYARTVIAANDELTPEDVEQRVAFRLRRQEAFLRRPRPGRLEMVVTAGALKLTVGSNDVMEAEMAHLRALDATREVTVRVLTPEIGLYAPTTGEFTLMDFDDPDDPPLAYVTSLVDARYFERLDYLTAYRRTFAKITALSVPLREYA